MSQRKKKMIKVLLPSNEPKIVQSEGELNVKVTIDQGHVILDFGKDIRWIGMPPKGAIEFAELIIKYATGLLREGRH